MITFNKKDLLPRIKRRKNQVLEDYIVRSINEEVKNAEEEDTLDFIQMQYFFESAFDDTNRRQEILDKVNQSNQ